jgi:HAD superfamily hydrolase (TIGR01509 family)
MPPFLLASRVKYSTIDARGDTMEIRAVLFDMDGILYDSEYWYMQGTLKQMASYGYRGPAEKVYQIIGTTMDGTYDILYGLLDGKISKQQLAADNDRYFLVDHPIDYRQIMFPGVPEEVKKLQDSGRKLAVCSSSPRATVDDSLKAMGIAQYFDYVESGEEIEHPKPDPDTYLRAAEALGVPARNCVVYEDSRMGIEAGKRAGMYTVAREDRRFGQDQSRADKIVKDIQELTAWIGREDCRCRK